MLLLELSLYLSLRSSNAVPQIHSLRAQDILEVLQIGCQISSSRRAELNPETLLSVCTTHGSLLSIQMGQAQQASFTGPATN